MTQNCDMRSQITTAGLIEFRQDNNAFTFTSRDNRKILCFLGVVRSCDPYKFYYYNEVFDSAYVLKDSDSSILTSCADDCVYTK